MLEFSVLCLVLSVALPSFFFSNQPHEFFVFLLCICTKLRDANVTHLFFNFTCFVIDRVCRFFQPPYF